MVQKDRNRTISVAVEYNQTGENELLTLNSPNAENFLVIDCTKLRSLTLQNRSEVALVIEIRANTTKKHTPTLISKFNTVSNITNSYSFSVEGYDRVSISINLVNDGIESFDGITIKSWYKGKN